MTFALTSPTRHLDRDVRYTPRAAVEALLASVEIPRGWRILDPAAGDGAILRVFRDAGYQRLYACEIRDEETEGLRAVATDVACCDWLERSEFCVSVEAIIMNPPYSLAREFCERALWYTSTVSLIAALLRCNVLGSSPWRKFWDHHPPTALRPIRRPSFTADGRTDASEYLWVLWHRDREEIDLRPA